MEIRLLNSEDAEAYFHIRLEGLKNAPEAFAASYEEEKDQPIEKYKNRFQSTNSFTFGAFQDGKLLGVVTLIKESLYKLRHRANIVAMYVSPEVRGVGTGKALLEETIKKANDLEDVEQVYLTVVSTNEAAISLYRSLGFEVFGIEKKALKMKHIYFDEEHMVLFL